MRLWGYQVKLEQLQNLSPRKPQFHIRRLKMKNREFQLSKYSSPKQKLSQYNYWLMHVSLTTQYSSLSTLMNLSLPIMTKVWLVTLSLIIGCCKCICSFGMVFMAINNIMQIDSKSDWKNAEFHEVSESDIWILLKSHRKLLRPTKKWEKICKDYDSMGAPKENNFNIRHLERPLEKLQKNKNNKTSSEYAFFKSMLES